MEIKERKLYEVNGEVFDTETEAALYLQELERKDAENRQREEEIKNEKQKVDELFNAFVKAKKEWQNALIQYNQKYGNRYPNILTYLF